MATNRRVSGSGDDELADGRQRVVSRRSTLTERLRCAWRGESGAKGAVQRQEDWAVRVEVMVQEEGLVRAQAVETRRAAARLHSASPLHTLRSRTGLSANETSSGPGRRFPQRCFDSRIRLRAAGTLRRLGDRRLALSRRHTLGWRILSRTLPCRCRLSGHLRRGRFW